VPLAVLCVLIGGCRSSVPFRGAPGPDAPVLALGGPVPYVRSARPSPHGPPPVVDQRGGLPLTPSDIYAATRATALNPAARRLPSRVYVPVRAGIDVIDPKTYIVVGQIPVGATPLRVVPSWDLRTLWVTERRGLVPINARTGRRGHTVPVARTADLYFTLDGRAALLMDARRGWIEVRDPHTMRRRSLIPVPCAGLTHADLSANGSTLVAGCAGTPRLVRVDLADFKVTGTLRLPDGARPQDVRLSPDGSTFYIADSGLGGVWLVGVPRFQVSAFVRTGRGARGLYPSRDASELYVTNGGERSVSVISIARSRVIHRWPLPAFPGSGGVSADGRLLWLVARGRDLIFAVSTRTGDTLHRVPAGPSPTDLCVHPQPGRFSLGHNGNYR
jgi:DNA-binding beta-propeller fold protein YncE